VDASSEAVGWVMRTLRFERWLDALASGVDPDGATEHDAADRVEEAQRPA
jgi:hypothetical protein